MALFQSITFKGSKVAFNSSTCSISPLQMSTCRSPKSLQQPSPTYANARRRATKPHMHPQYHDPLARISANFYSVFQPAMSSPNVESMGFSFLPQVPFSIFEKLGTKTVRKCFTKHGIGKSHEDTIYRLSRVQVLLRDLGQALSSWMPRHEVQMPGISLCARVSKLGHALPSVQAQNYQASQRLTTVPLCQPRGSEGYPVRHPSVLWDLCSSQFGTSHG